MQTAIKLNATVLPGHRIEIINPILPIGKCVEVVISDEATSVWGQYPSAINAEYDRLTDKKLNGTITDEEAIRLKDICHIIDEIDRVTLYDDIRVTGV